MKHLSMIILFTLVVWITFFSQLAHGCTREDEFNKVVEMVYHEAKGESFYGKLAVATVAVERKYARGFGDTLCDVINAPYQFSYFWDGKKEVFKDEKALEEAIEVANCVVYNGCTLETVRGAKWYYACDGLYKISPPYWTTHYKLLAKVGNHCFYK